MTVAIGALVVLGALFIWMRPAVAPENGMVEREAEISPSAPDSATKFSPAPAAPPKYAPTSPQPPTLLGKNQGRIVLALTDEMMALDTLKSLVITIQSIEIQSPAQGWIIIFNSVKAFDLLRLFMSSEKALLADMVLDAGTYTQLRIRVNSIFVSTKNGTTADAKLPSKELKIPLKLIVEKGGKSGITIDILGDKSLHSAGSGKFVFAPVLRIETQSNIGTIEILGERVDFIGGKSDSDLTFGMNENGEIRVGFTFDPRVSFEVIGDAVRIISPAEQNCRDLVNKAAVYYEPYQEASSGSQRSYMLSECQKYFEKSCTSNQECGAFPCVSKTCFIQTCQDDNQCPQQCSLHATSIPRFCTPADVR